MAVVMGQYKSYLIIYVYSLQAEYNKCIQQMVLMHYQYIYTQTALDVYGIPL